MRREEAERFTIAQEMSAGNLLAAGEFFRSAIVFSLSPVSLLCSFLVFFLHLPKWG
jgi:hypothetical protein